jgi:lysophospholipase L1-like esterase
VTTRITVALMLIGSVACGSSLGKVTPAPAPAASTPAEPPAAEAPASEVAASEDAPAEVTAPEKARFTITKGTRVLIFGDSMVTSGLGVYLKERVVARGGKFFSISKGSSTTATWSDGRELQDLITRLHPDVVLVVLASNELFVPNPQARRYAVRAIVERVGSRPCLWIGPAPWLPEKGIIGVVREAAAPCRFYDSSPLALERQADHIHPTLLGGKVWADAVWHDAFED